MTAEIGLLNKSAVVIAADSAVTIGQGNRVYNNANKIYELKSCKHIGIMIYNNASLMEIPIETIIKLYSNEMTKTFKSLKDYSDNFITYLSTFLSKHVTKNQVDEIIEMLTYLTLDSITSSVTETVNEEQHFKKKELENTKIRLHTEIAEYILEDLKSKDIQNELKTYTLKKFSKDYKDLIDKIINLHIHHHNITLDQKFNDLILEILYYDSVRKIDAEDDYTGIIITGFGDDEIYPGYIELHINGFLNNTLKWNISKFSSIDHERTVIVRPFAQRDMSDVFFRGIDSELYSKTVEILEKEYSEIDDFINNNFRLTKEKKEKINDFLVKSINNIHNSITKICDEEYISPIIDTIDTFRKEDLIEIAESLISITSLKRKTSSNVQSVGGPVDIAVITKGDGFRWIKSKHLKIV